MELTIEAIDMAPFFGMGIVLGTFSLLYLLTFLKQLRFLLGLPLALGLTLSISGSLFVLPPLTGSVASALQTNPQRESFLEALGSELGTAVVGDGELDELFRRPSRVADLSAPIELSYVLDGAPRELTIVAKRTQSSGDRYSFELYLDSAEGRGLVAFDPGSLSSMRG